MRQDRTLNGQLIAAAEALCLMASAVFGLTGTANAATIANGTYSVPYKVMNATNANQESMMNDAVDGAAKVTVKSVGKNAFKGINKKATVKAPKKQLKKYQKLCKKAGASKSVKFE
jgi:heme-binding NEAT domain protein